MTSRAHVLIADDDGDSREILSIILDGEGYRTTLASRSKRYWTA